MPARRLTRHGLQPGQLLCRVPKMVRGNAAIHQQHQGGLIGGFLGQQPDRFIPGFQSLAARQLHRRQFDPHLKVVRIRPPRVVQQGVGADYPPLLKRHESQLTERHLVGAV